MTNKEVAISIHNLSKSYVIGKKKEGSLRHALSGVFKGKLGSEEKFWALKDISFDIEKGDVIGIIGKNGAGKSTLLKVLSKITQPTEGRVEINGRVASLLEVGTGFHPELTGRENIYLNGTLLGMTRKEVAEKLEEIVEFSGVRKFIDTPVKHYSSGMYVRLAFSVAAHLEPEILIIDEVLAVGDAEFQKKCLGKMGDIAGEGRTVIFVSHDLNAILTLCNKGVLLEKGRIVKGGLIKDIIEKYNMKIIPSIYYTNKTTGFNFIKSVEIDNFSDNNKMILQYEDEITISFILTLDSNNTLLNLGVAIKDFKGSKVTTINKKLIGLSGNEFSTKLKIDARTFYNGSYTIDCAIFEKNATVFEYLEDCLTFKINDSLSELSSYQAKDIGSIKIGYSWV